MAYTPEQIEQKFEYILKEIEDGRPLRQILREYDMPSTSTFYKWLEETDEEGNPTLEAKDKTKRYARACDFRADALFEEVLEIADKQGEDVIGEDENGNQIINHNIIQRNRLQVDARKWMVGKLNPKKYGDRIQNEHSGSVNTVPVSAIQVEIVTNQEDED